ncbi:MAG: enoyl-CoA hydratase [Candidatus Eiseniibacteriota bacterium]
MSDARVTARVEDHTGWLTFSNPARLNALTFEMWQQISEHFAAFAANDAVRVVVLRGDGDKAFISGADISQFESKRGTKDARDVYNQATYAASAAIQNCPVPTIAMINGYCIGGGLGVALGCDLRIAASNARFAIPAAKLGLGYDYVGVKRLVDVVGPSFAKEIFYTARQFDAEEARVMGLVNRVVAVDALEGYVRDYANTIAANAPLTIKAAKLAVNAAIAGTEPANLAEVRGAVGACFESEDYKEGRRAFTEKRKPKFRGA